MIEILQNIPMNSKLYSPLIGECTIYRLSDTKIIIQNSENPNIKETLDSEGKKYPDGEVMLFPSYSDRSWKECTFKKGDLIGFTNCNNAYKFNGYKDNNPLTKIMICDVIIYVGGYSYCTQGGKVAKVKWNINVSCTNDLKIEKIGSTFHYRILKTFELYKNKENERISL